MAPTKGQIIGELERLKEVLAGQFSYKEEDYILGIALRDKIIKIENMVNSLPTEPSMTAAGLITTTAEGS